VNDGVSVVVGAVRRGCETAETKKTARKPWEIEDGLWARIEPLLPVVQRSYRHPGRKRLDPRKVLCEVRRFEITPHIARRGTEHGSGLGRYRWVVEAAFALLHWFRRLRIRWEIRDDIHEAFLTLGCAII
jgi:transposase